MSRAKAAKELNFALERMTEHDLLDVINIEEACGLSVWGWDGYYGELESSDSIMIVARFRGSKLFSNTRAVGFVAARVCVDEMHVNNIGVADYARRCGVGSALMEEALRRGCLLGARRAFLEVRASNRAAQILYGRYGFREKGRRRNYYKNPSEDALVMLAEFGIDA